MCGWSQAKSNVVERQARFAYRWRIDYERTNEDNEIRNKDHIYIERRPLRNGMTKFDTIQINPKIIDFRFFHLKFSGSENFLYGKFPFYSLLSGALPIWRA